MKPQTVRLFDVFFIGPLMTWAGWKLRPQHPRAGTTLAVLGVGTVVYNGRNWLRVREMGAEPESDFAERAQEAAAPPEPAAAPSTAEGGQDILSALSGLVNEAQSYDQTVSAG